MSELELISNRHPPVSQIVAPGKYLEIAAVWNQLLNDLIDLHRLLTLASTLRIDDVAGDVSNHARWVRALPADQAGLLGVLEVETVALREPAVHRALYPGDLVHKGVSPLLHKLKRKLVLCVDDPHEQEAILLQRREWDLLNESVRELLVPDRNTTSGVRSGQLPGRISHDHVKELACRPALHLGELVKVELANVCVDRHTAWRRAPNVVRVVH
mmetsp:Transcript_6768/g.18912  ORF Transcript_6768/g.18912 Transcript_6768/m.18912 type:complete len:214 (+) Transcript_6768:1699-2340(+)